MQCKICGKEINHPSSGLCKQCYSREWQRKHKGSFHSVNITKERIYINDDTVSNKDIQAYLKYIKNQIYEDVLQNPKKYLKEV